LIVPKGAGAGNGMAAFIEQKRFTRWHPCRLEGTYMDIVSVFYAAFGYLALLCAILWAMLFVGDGSAPARIDALGTSRPFQDALADGALLLFLAILHRWLSRGKLADSLRRRIPRELQRSTRAWVASVVLIVIFCAWRPVPQVLWSLKGAPELVFSSLFYVAWTLVLIGTYLAEHLDLSEIPHSSIVDGGRTLRQPIYVGILVGVWSTSVMSVGHLLLAGAITGCLLLNGLADMQKARAPLRARDRSESSPLLQGRRIAR
jgi:methanethiol S-methyltransferase